MSGKFQQKIPVLLEKRNYYFRINEKQQNHNLVLQNIYIYIKKPFQDVRVKQHAISISHRLKLMTIIFQNL